MNPTHCGAHCGVSLCWYACTVLYVAMVCANPAVESPGSCREGAGSIPAVRVAALQKRRFPAGARLQRMRPPPHAAGLQDAQAARAAGGGGGAFFAARVGGFGVWGGCMKKSEAHLPLPVPVDPVAACAVVGGGGAFTTIGGIEPPL